MDSLAANLPHLNASLNVLATILLLIGGYLAKQGKYDSHRRVMILCFVVSSVFLGCYLLHKFALWETTGQANKPFPRDPAIASVAARYTYFTILLTHLILAITVPFLAIAAIVAGLRDRRTAHRQIVRWAWPIWLYVSITGVLVYAMLYHLYRP